MENKESQFYDSIIKFNQIYKLPINTKPTLLGIEQLKRFKSILYEEIKEVEEIIQKYELSKTTQTEEERLDILTAISDWLGDLMVYITSESVKYGLDIKDILKIIMQSNFSKLDMGGKPIYDNRGKVMKGPSYWRPELKIKEFLRRQLS